MNKPTQPKREPETQTGHAMFLKKPVFAERRGRGRLGGSLKLDLLAQRAVHAGRRVKLLDGDLRSATLALRYPSIGPNGESIEDAATVPPSEELPAVKAWLMAALDDMAEDRVSRLLDLGGGDRVMQEFVRDLSLPDYCAEFGIDLLSIYMLGPDVEDFRHMLEVVRSSDLTKQRTLLVMNEGVIRSGQSVDGVFQPIMNHADMKALIRDGARPVFMRRLTCMEQVRASGMGFYDIAEGRLDANGVRPRATMQHMVKAWLEENERQHVEAGTAEWLP